MDDVDSDDHDQEEVIIIPIKDKNGDPSSTAIGYTTENGVTVVSIEKSKNVLCEI